MAIFKIDDLVKSLQSSQEEGYEYVDIDILVPDDEADYSTIVLDYIIDSMGSTEDMIDSVNLPDDYSTLTED